MTQPSKAELLALFEHSTDAVVIVDVASDLVTAANRCALDRLGVTVGAPAADASLEGAYLSLSALAAEGLRGPVADERVCLRGRAYDVRTVELPADNDATIAVVLRDLTDSEAAVADERIRGRLEVARSISCGLVARLLDPCVVLSANLEFLAQVVRDREQADAVGEAQEALRAVTVAVTALRELALPDDTLHAAPVETAIEAAVALAGSELGDIAKLSASVAPGAVAAVSRPLLALLGFHLLTSIGRRLRDVGRVGSEIRVVVAATDSRITVRLEHGAEPLAVPDPDAGATMLSSMVSAAGGQLSEGGDGAASWVEIQLPRASARAARQLAEGAARKAPASEVPSSPGSAGGRRRLLLVDDDETICTALARLLGPEYEVRVAADASGALAALEERLPELVISDVNMPRMNGAELLRTAVGRWPQLARRFVFLTGGSMDGETLRTILAEGIPCLLKPVGRTELVEAIDGVLGTSADVAASG